MMMAPRRPRHRTLARMVLAARRRRRRRLEREQGERQQRERQRCHRPRSGGDAVQPEEGRHVLQYAARPASQPPRQPRPPTGLARRLRSVRARAQAGTDKCKNFLQLIQRTQRSAAAGKTSPRGHRASCHAQYPDELLRADGLARSTARDGASPTRRAAAWPPVSRARASRAPVLDRLPDALTLPSPSGLERRLERGEQGERQQGFGNGERPARRRRCRATRGRTPRAAVRRAPASPPAPPPRPPTGTSPRRLRSVRARARGDTDKCKNFLQLIQLNPEKCGSSKTSPNVPASCHAQYPTMNYCAPTDAGKIDGNGQSDEARRRLAAAHRRARPSRAPVLDRLPDALTLPRRRRLERRLERGEQGERQQRERQQRGGGDAVQPEEGRHVLQYAARPASPPAPPPRPPTGTTPPPTLCARARAADTDKCELLAVDPEGPSAAAGCQEVPASSRAQYPEMNYCAPTNAGKIDGNGQSDEARRRLAAAHRRARPSA